MRGRALLNVAGFSASLGLLACLSMAPALADGMSSRAPAYTPVSTFGGFYVGGHLGYALSGPQGSLFDDGVGSGEVIMSPTFRRPLAGVQGGYNLQSGNYLLGVEVDWSWSDSRTTTTPEPDSARATLRDLGSVRARGGFVWDRALLFGTIGWGWARGDYRFGDGDEGTLRAHLTDTGLVWGGGLEVLVHPQVTLRGEYLHYDFGKDRFIAAPAALNGNSDASVKIDNVDEVRLSVNFKFGDDRRPVLLK